ncbi:MAG: 23S rRNA pseudouridine(1911/1915/1917) synthase RluD [Candidatus Porifericomitaceae bacterium WSBS_2022_MAG_OTU9]
MNRELTLLVPIDAGKQRLDKVLSSHYQQYSRSRLQQWIRDGFVQLNNKVATQTRQTVQPEDIISLNIPEMEPEYSMEAEAIELSVVYQDPSMIVLNKPPGLVVHPGAGNRNGTLLNALLHHDPGLCNIPRAGLIHRLDKDTSGLLLVARKLESHNALVQQMQKREIKRSYQAVVSGKLRRGGTIEAALGRDRRNRTKIAVTASGKNAITHYKIMESFTSHTMLNIQLETGRTHQIRVHLAWLGHPVLGDPAYGRRQLPGKDQRQLHDILHAWRRQALHAWQLQLLHPLHGKSMQWQVDAPADMQQLLTALRADAAT